MTTTAAAPPLHSIEPSLVRTHRAAVIITPAVVELHDLAGQLTRIRGRPVIAGYHQDGLRQVNTQLWNWREIDAINAHERDPTADLEGLRMALDSVRKGRLVPTDSSPIAFHSISWPQHLP